VLDGRNCLDPLAVEAVGMTYEGIGRQVPVAAADDWATEAAERSRRVGVR
jgi:hypothetical protein